MSKARRYPFAYVSGERESLPYIPFTLGYKSDNIVVSGLLATVAVQPDWIPALEWARFQAWRRTNSPERSISRAISSWSSEPQLTPMRTALS